MHLKNIKDTKSEVAVNTAFLLSKYEDSRDYNSRDFELLYLLENYCNTEEEKRILQRILKKAPSGATIKRYRAHIQNKLWLYPKSDKKKKLDREIELNVKTNLKKWFFTNLFNLIIR